MLRTKGQKARSGANAGWCRMVVTVRTSPAPATHHRYHHHRAEGRGSIFPAAVTQ